MAGKAESSIQKHIFAARAVLSDMGTVLPNPDREGYDKASGRSWRFILHDGLIKFEFTPFITWGESREVSRRAHEKNISRRVNEETGELLLPDDSRIVRTIPLLTDTSKMGAYSFSLAAGPPSLGGTCPCASIGFRLPDGGKSFVYENSAGKDVVDGISAGQQLKMRRHLLQLMPGLPDPSDTAAWEPLEKKYICNGCYALKNSYGNPSQIMGLYWRTLWTVASLKNGKFVPTMIAAMDRAFEIARHKTAAAKTDRQKAGACNPNFFRIHDSGDFGDPSYFRAWCEIARHFKRVLFWAPTRVWAVPEIMASLLRAVGGKVPGNLIIRPSSLWFDMPPPAVQGLAAGSTAAEMRYRVVGQDVEVSGTNVGPDVWMCPAYLPTPMGGGALPKYKRRKKVKTNPLETQRFPVIRPGEIVGVAPPHKEFEFYDAEIDETGAFVIDSKTGKPKRATKETPRDRVASAQAFAPSGACELAIGAEGRPCRICWGVPRLPHITQDGTISVSYAKH